LESSRRRFFDLEDTGGDAGVDEAAERANPIFSRLSAIIKAQTVEIIDLFYIRICMGVFAIPPRIFE
jgi:hypothetical protein